MSDAFDPVAAAAALRDKIVDEAPRLHAENARLRALLRDARPKLPIALQTRIDAALGDRHE